jgi:hypothetical protein
MLGFPLPSVDQSPVDQRRFRFDHFIALDHLRDSVRDGALDQIARADANNIVQPRVLRRAGFKKWIGPEVVLRGVELTSSEPSMPPMKGQKITN